MDPAALLVDALGRTLEGAEAVLAALSDEELLVRPGPEDRPANPVAWLVWHLARVQDDHVAQVAGLEQVWTAQGFARRAGLPLDDADIGYGHADAQVAQVRLGGELLGDYLRAVHAQSVGWVGGVTAADLDRVVDERWDPPVTLGVRLVSVVDDCAQHVGQAAYVRGLLGR